MQAHRLGVLHRKLAKPADPGDGNPLAGLRLGLLDALVAGDAGTKDRPHFCEIAFLRQSPHVRRGADHVFGEPAIDAVTRVVLRPAQAVPSGHAIFALTTGIMQPGNTHRVALFQAVDPGTARRDDARSFMAGDKRKRRPARPITVSGMEICVTDAGRHDLDQDFAWARRRDWHLLNRQGLAEDVHHPRSHRPWHAFPLQFLQPARSSKSERMNSRPPRSSVSCARVLRPLWTLQSPFVTT